MARTTNDTRTAGELSLAYLNNAAPIDDEPLAACLAAEADLRALLAERDTLAAEVDALRADVDAYRANMATLTAALAEIREGGAK